jgi:hypothetical protein
MGAEELGDTHLLDLNFAYRCLAVRQQNGPAAAQAMLVSEGGDGEDAAEESEEEMEDDDDDGYGGQMVQLPNGAVVPAALLMQLMQQGVNIEAMFAGMQSGEEGEDEGGD